MARKQLLDYVWNTQIIPQIGYSFSRLHSQGYSLIALQEMNLASRFPQIYWDTACLSIDASADNENDTNKSTNYGKVASAIGKMQSRGTKVALPDINKADFGFKPDVDTNSIIFGLKAVQGMNDDIVREIINHRPYDSFDDFIRRMFLPKIVQKQHMLQLIKGGAFDSFGDRTEIMKQFITMVSEPKEKLTLANLSTAIEYEIIPKELHGYVRLFKFKKYISQKKFIVKTVPTGKSKDHYLKLETISIDFITQQFDQKELDKFVVEDTTDGHLIISEKKFKTQYNKKMQPMKDWLATGEALALFNDKLIKNEWDKNCSGNISHWEMESISMYYHEHELAHVARERYDVKNFFELPTEPIRGQGYKWHGKQMYQFELCRIAGTVLDKDKNRHTVTLLTPEGVVQCKLYAGSFAFYSKQLSKKLPNGKKQVVDPSWFKKGTLLLITGFRRGDNFIPKKYRNSIYRYTLEKIDSIDELGRLQLTSSRPTV